MDTVQDFEDILHMLEKHAVRYMIIGGLAFIYHAKPRYTKDLDLWINSATENEYRAKKAFIVPDTSISSTCRANSPNRNHYLGVTAADRLFPGQGNFKRKMTDPSGFRPIDVGEIVP